MDENQVMLSLSLLTENTKMIKSNINKLQSDVAELQINGVNINVSNEVTANSNDPVSSGAIYTYVNQNLSSAGGNTLAQTFDITNSSESVSASLVNDYLNNNNYVTSINPSSSATTGQVLTVNDQGDAAWDTPVTELPPTTSALSGQVLSLNANKNLYWNTPSPLPEFFRFVATVDQGDITWPSLANEATPSVPYWSISSGSSPVTLNGGAAFVAPYDGTYNVNLSLAIINSTLTASDKYILYIYKVNPNNYYAIQDAIKTAVQTYNFTTAVYDDTYTVSGATSFPLGGQTNANLVVDTGGTIPDNSDVAFNGMLGNATSYISLNDHNSYFSGINSLNEFSIEMNFKILSGSPYLFTMYSSSRWEVQLLAASGSLEYLLTWRRSAVNTLFGYATIQIPDRTSFHHLILVFKSTGVTIYLNGAEYTPVQYDPIGFGLNTITSIHLGRHNLYTDTGEERFRSFRFYESAVSVDEAFQLYAKRQWERISHEFTPDGNPTYIINSELDFDLTTGDELHVSLGGQSSVAGRQYTLSSGAESRITVKLNMIDNQNYPEYFLAVDNSNQVVWAAAPNSSLPTNGTSGQILTLDSSNPPQAVWAAGIKYTHANELELNGNGQAADVALRVRQTPTSTTGTEIRNDGYIIASGLLVGGEGLVVIGALPFSNTTQVPTQNMYVPRNVMFGPRSASMTSGDNERLLLNCMIGVGRGDVDLKTDQNSHYTTAERDAATNDQALRYGTTGQVLTSGGYGNPLKWTTVGGGQCAQLSGKDTEDTYTDGWNWPFTHSNAFYFQLSDYDTDFAHGITIVGTQAQHTVGGTLTNVFDANRIPMRFQIGTAGIYKMSGMVHYMKNRTQVSYTLAVFYRVRRPSSNAADTYPYDATWTSEAGTSPLDALEQNDLPGRSTIELSKLLDLQVGDEVYFGFSSNESITLKHMYNNFHLFRVR